MKKMNYLLILLISIFSCQTETPTQFTEAALNDIFITQQDQQITFKDILATHKGQTIVIDIWASWCGDCIKGMPTLKALQKKHKNVTYIFLSLDRSLDAWKKGIKKYGVEGTHYYMQSGWDGAFGKFINLDWIPRYMVIDASGTIQLFKAIKANDKRIKGILNQNK